MHEACLPTRRALLAALAALPLPMLAQPARRADRTLVEVWKDPNCGCCKDWVSHLEQNGFAVKVNDTGNEAMRAKLGIPRNLGSCHTALVGAYAIEGHVPAADILRLLKTRPEAVGLSVPGMPVGSPGMDGPVYGGRRDPFDVLLVQKSGNATVYASYHKTSTAPGRTPGPTAEAEVRKVDKSKGKITLRHGEIRNLDMPPMTMVFGVADKAFLDKVKAGDKVRFTADKDRDGQYIVTGIEARK
ncbi:MAG: hypothetical protein K0R89_2143 [Ramlibacter sp.]|jgi:hypothetical protein|nr:hypothetical protein [Ramlibacter sp.]